MIGPDGKAIASVAQGSFPMMVEYLLPPGLRGIVVAGLLSALMGSLAGVFNACSTLFTVDLYEKWRPSASQHEIVRMGRIATATMVLIALAWIPVIKGASESGHHLIMHCVSVVFALEIPKQSKPFSSIVMKPQASWIVPLKYRV